MNLQPAPVDVPKLVFEAVTNTGFVGLPSNLIFHNEKLYFLARTPLSQLYVVDVPTTIPKEGEELPTLQWQPLIDSRAFEKDLTSELSKEEQLRRERMRAASFGLTDYHYNREKKIILFSTARDLYIVDTQQVPQRLRRIESLINTPSDVPIDPSLSPDASFVAFIRYSDIWINHIESGKEVRLTWSNPENLSTSKLTSGVAEFIMQEEFDRMTGYWWSPVVHNNRYQIAYFEVDLSQVLVYKIPQPEITGEVDEYLYPLTGTPNAISNVCIVEFDATNLNELKSKVKRLSPSLKERFPWMEYVPRCEWSSDGKKVCVQLLDRKQQHLLYIAIDQSEFRDEKLSVTQVNPMSGIQILKEETTHFWINIHDMTYHYTDGSGRIIFASEMTGFRHLYQLIPPKSDKSLDRYQIRTITQGDNWQVDDDILIVDEKRELVYFMGTKESPLEKHLYVASTAPEANPTQVNRLTSAGFWHEVTFEMESKTRFVSIFCNVEHIFTVQVFQIVHPTNARELPSKTVAIYEVKLPDTLLKPPLVSFPINPPKFFDFVSSRGEKIFGCYYLPQNYDPKKKYPTVLKVYGGPHVQLVTNHYKLTRNMNNQMLASLGYVVVMIDGVGSFRRGLQFEGYLRCRMGTVEVQDQMEGLKYLIAKGLVDPSRIAVQGWSYGGYLSLMCLAQQPHFFKMAISGAPVTLWEAYDTGYTERYMDTPEENPSGYLTGSVLTYASKFPSEPNRLMIAHGAIDENVHICHSYKLVQELINEKKPFVFLVYPEERHGLTKSTHTHAHSQSHTQSQSQSQDYIPYLRMAIDICFLKFDRNRKNLLHFEESSLRFVLDNL